MCGGIARLLVRYTLLAVAVVLLNFLLPRLLPGDPLGASAGEGTDAAVPLSAATRAHLREYYHLDEPLGRQLTSYLGDLARGDLGWSITRPAPVRTLLLARLPWTLGLLLTSVLIAAILGTALGLVAGWFPGSRRDRLLVSVTAALSALPEFLIAIGLLLVFSIALGWFPLLGGQTAFAGYESDAVGRARRVADILWHLTLPASTLVLSAASGFLLITRDTTVGIHRQPWLTTARAKGLRERQVAIGHALPNLAFPLLTFVVLRLGSVLGGALVVERVFGVPGLGFLAFQAIQARDYPVLQALFLVSGLGVLAASFLVELAYLRLDPQWGSASG
ncbi:MAG: ABC transporter permease [Chloroflexota bacterium]|nr:ABC transporter permease [Chloroflexota bacterium]